MSLRFEWDDQKAAFNVIKHGVSFELATMVFLDLARLERYDSRRDEDRFVAAGLVGGVELTIVYTMRGDRHRIISARRSERHEQSKYWQNR